MSPVPKKWLLHLLCICLLIAGCKSGEKLYNKGRYDEAVAAFVQKLRKKPKDETALRLLPDAYAQALQKHESIVNNLMVSNNELKWESIKQQYRILQAIYNDIHNSPGALSVVTPKDYSEAISGARENAAEVRYQRGAELLQRNDKQSARQAFDELSAALQQIGNYKDAASLRDQAYALGVTNVIISRIEVRSPYYQFSVDQFRASLVHDLQQYSGMGRFVKFYDEGLARTNNIRPDLWLQMQFFDFVIGQTNTDRFQQELSKDVVIKTNIQDSTGKFIERTIAVKGVFTTVTKTVISKGLMDYQLTENGSNRVVAQDRLPGSYTWQNQFAYFKGDDRVLSDVQKKLLSIKELPPPPPQDLFMLFTQPIYDQMARNLQQLSGSL